MNLYQTITDKKLRKAINQRYKNFFQNFNRLKLRFNRLFIPAIEIELTQTIINRDRKIYITRFILVHSTLSYIQFSEQPLGSISNQFQITPTHHKQVILKTTRPTHPPLQHYTPQVRTPSDFAEFHTHLQLMKVQLQEP